ncbi:hypothetical protein AB4K20DRAFT_1865352 [Rhizopus microsporus]
MAYKNIIIDRCHILPIVMLVIIVDPVSKVLVLVVVVVIIQLTVKNSVRNMLITIICLSIFYTFIISVFFLYWISLLSLLIARRDVRCIRYKIMRLLKSNDTFITFTTCPLHQLTINSIQHEVRYSFILLKLFLILVAVVFRSSVVSVSLTADSHFNISRHVDGY